MGGLDRVGLMQVPGSSSHFPTFPLPSQWPSSVRAAATAVCSAAKQQELLPSELDACARCARELVA